MSYILGIDLSQFQGTSIDFNQVKSAGYQFGITRMTYAYPGQNIKIDPTASQNYYGMVSANILPGGYHKIGWTDPIAEADAFVNAMSPLGENDLLAHDMEPASDVNIPANWSDWEQTYVQRVHDRTGVWSLRYANISMNNAMPAGGVASNCGPWVAAPSFGPDDDIPVSVTVIMQQGATAHVPGITENVTDVDYFFGTIDQLKAYGYHAAQPAPEPAPTPTPVPTPAPDPVPTPTPEPEPTPTPQPQPDPTPETPAQNWITRFIDWLKKLFGVK